MPRRPSIKDERALCTFYGIDYDSFPLEERNRRLSRLFYRGTYCGAWAEVVYREERRNGGWHLVGWLRIGSIVEGSDIEPCIETQELRFPFSVKALEKAIARVEEDAEAKWQEINGEERA